MSGRGDSKQSSQSSSRRIPDDVRKILPGDTANAWTRIAPHLPKELYLGGGTAVAVHLKHRESRDLDFFFHKSVDLGALKKRLTKLEDFAVTEESEGTLKGLLGKTKIEIFNAGALKILEQPSAVAGLKVASIQDLMAMKLKVLGERGEMRDYFDVKAIDEQGGVSIEEGIELYRRRYSVGPTSDVVMHLIKALGDLSDVEVDEALPTSKTDLAKWWQKRQTAVIRNLDRS